MKTDELTKLVEDTFEKVKILLFNKQKEYAIPDDVLINFKKAAAMLGVTPEQALWGMLVKHIISIQDLANGLYKPYIKVVNEKINDNIAYLLLLKGMFYEKDL